MEVLHCLFRFQMMTYSETMFHIYIMDLFCSLYTKFNITLFYVNNYKIYHKNWFWHHLSFYSGWLSLDAKKVLTAYYDSSVDGLSEWKGLIPLFYLCGYAGITSLYYLITFTILYIITFYKIECQLVSVIKYCNITNKRISYFPFFFKTHTKIYLKFVQILWYYVQVAWFVFGQ